MNQQQVLSVQYSGPPDVMFDTDICYIVGVMPFDNFFSHDFPRTRELYFNIKQIPDLETAVETLEECGFYTKVS